MISVQIPPNIAVVTALSLHTRAFYAEILRGGIVFIERRQCDACGGVSMNYVVGLTGADARG
jgi:ABC-type amino acid transport system permease subunit